MSTLASSNMGNALHDIGQSGVRCEPMVLDGIFVLDTILKEIISY
jgi:hypothetical protein